MFKSKLIFRIIGVIFVISAISCSADGDFNEMTGDINLIAPTDGKYISNAVFKGTNPSGITFKWSEISNAKSFNISINGGAYNEPTSNIRSNITNPVTVNASEGFSYDWIQELPPSEFPYSWFVYSQNEFQYLNSKQIYEFYVYPGEVTLNFPDEGKNCYTKEITFKWERVIKAISYKIIVSENSDFSNPIIEEVTTNTEYYVPDTLTELNKDYYWKVIATLDDNTTEVEGSSSFYFGKDLSAVLISPLTGSCKDELTLVWDHGTDNFLGYEIYIRADDVAGSDFVKIASDIPTTTTTYTITKQQFLNAGIGYCNGLFTWKIKTIQTECGDYESTASFIHGDEFGRWESISGTYDNPIPVNPTSKGAANNDYSLDALYISPSEDAALAGLYVAYIETSPRTGTTNSNSIKLVKFNESTKTWDTIASDLNYNGLLYFGYQISLTYGGGKIYVAWSERDHNYTTPADDDVDYHLFAKRCDNTGCEAGHLGGNTITYTTKFRDWNAMTPDIHYFNNELYISYYLWGQSATTTANYYRVYVRKYNSGSDTWSDVGCITTNDTDYLNIPYESRSTGNVPLSSYGNNLYISYSNSAGDFIKSYTPGATTWQKVFEGTIPSTGNAIANNILIPYDKAGTETFLYAFGKGAHIYCKEYDKASGIWSSGGFSKEYIDVNYFSSGKIPTMTKDTENVPYVGWSQPDPASISSVRVTYWNSTCGQWINKGQINNSLDQAAGSPVVFFKDDIPHIAFFEYAADSSVDIFVKKYVCEQ